MATYEYVCKACNQEYEVEQSMKDDCLTKCPDCGEDELRRKIVSGGFILKGSGWSGPGKVGSTGKKVDKKKLKKIPTTWNR